MTFLNSFMPLKARLGLILLGLTVLQACGGGGGGSDAEDQSNSSDIAGVQSFEILDPNPEASKKFPASGALILSNGNFVIREQYDATGEGDYRANVYLYDPSTQAVIATISDDNNGDNLGADDESNGIPGIVGLANGNFVIISSRDDVNGVVNAGSVMYINGQTGQQIGSTISGDHANDNLGSDGIVELSNGNFVIASDNDNTDTKTQAGSIILVDGQTGAVVGTPLRGNDDYDRLGAYIENRDAIAALPNGNFVVTNHNDDRTGLIIGGPYIDAGQVFLVNGSTGTKIGETFEGDNSEDWIGENGVEVLPNGNYVVASKRDDVSGLTNAGSVYLFDGNTGDIIGSPVVGDAANDQVGEKIMVPSSGHSNFVVASYRDDNGAIDQAGVVKLINGSTGAEIAEHKGQSTSDWLGVRGDALANGNFIIISGGYDVGMVANAGYIAVIDGTTGAILGTPISNTVSGNWLNPSWLNLSNGNSVLILWEDPGTATTRGGRVMLVDGSTGAELGTSFIGDQDYDSSGIKVTELSGGNFVVTTPGDDVDGRADAGSVRLVSGTTGLPIGSVLVGESAGNALGGGGVVNINDSYYALVSDEDDVSGQVDVGTVRIIDANTNEELVSERRIGGSAGDFSNWTLSVANDESYYIVAFPQYDKDGLVDSGLAYLIGL